MNILHLLHNTLGDFLLEEEGAQIVEYGLIIAVISLILIVGLGALGKDGGGFKEMVGKVTTCLTTPASCAA